MINEIMREISDSCYRFQNRSGQIGVSIFHSVDALVSLCQSCALSNITHCVKIR